MKTRAKRPASRREESMAKNFVCLAGGAALRCSELPACGGVYATDQVAEWGSISAGVFGRSCVRAADRQVRSHPGGVGGGSCVDGDQFDDGPRAEAGAPRQIRRGARQ